LRAGRLLAPVRAAGLILAGSGRRRLGDRLVVGGAAANALAVLVASPDRSDGRVGHGRRATTMP
jgi:hypothetical protein